MCKEYNGYTNYQTWNISLWMDNDEGTYDLVREMASQLVKPSRLADWLKDYTESSNPLTDNASMFSDLMGHALAIVNWYEIAENVLSE